MTRTDPRTQYDWRAELGVLPEVKKRLPGQSNGAHPMTVALLRLQPEYRARAKTILKHIVTISEGRIDYVAEVLGCSWHVAQRLVKAAGLSDFAGTMRFEHNHHGPTGQGTQPRTRVKKDVAPAPKRRRKST